MTNNEFQEHIQMIVPIMEGSLTATRGLQVIIENSQIAEPARSELEQIRRNLGAALIAVTNRIYKVQTDNDFRLVLHPDTVEALEGPPDDTDQAHKQT